jgi:hypothetical protein
MSTEVVKTDDRIQRYKSASHLLRRWLEADDDDYDERVGDARETELHDSRLRCAETDEPAA